MILTVTLNASIDRRFVVKKFAGGKSNRVKTCVCTPGGKGLNVTRCVKTVGEDVLATGFLGGHTGKLLEELLQEDQVKTDFYYLKKESRCCINIFDETDGSQTEFLEPGFNVTEDEFQGFMGKYEKLVDKADVVVMSGSLPTGICGDSYQRLIQIAKKAGKKVILDTSGNALKLGIEAMPDMIKPNIDEICMLTGNYDTDESALADAAEKIYRQGVGVVVISLGEKGSLIVSNEGTFRAEVPAIEPVNTVGCGDAMIAGYAIGMKRMLGIEETIRLGSAISVSAALQETTGVFMEKDMRRVLPQIKVIRLQKS